MATVLMIVVGVASRLRFRGASLFGFVCFGSCELFSGEPQRLAGAAARHVVVLLAEI